MAFIKKDFLYIFFYSDFVDYYIMENKTFSEWFQVSTWQKPGCVVFIYIPFITSLETQSDERIKHYAVMLWDYTNSARFWHHAVMANKFQEQRTGFCSVT